MVDGILMLCGHDSKNMVAGSCIACNPSTDQQLEERAQAIKKRDETFGPRKKWMGSTPEKCEMCHGPFTDRVFYDTHLPYQPSRWGLFCYNCFTALGCKVGTSLGQKYDLITWEKLEG